MEAHCYYIILVGQAFLSTRRRCGETVLSIPIAKVMLCRTHRRYSLFEFCVLQNVGWYSIPRASSPTSSSTSTSTSSGTCYWPCSRCRCASNRFFCIFGGAGCSFSGVVCLTFCGLRCIAISAVTVMTARAHLANKIDLSHSCLQWREEHSCLQ